MIQKCQEYHKKWAVMNLELSFWDYLEEYKKLRWIYGKFEEESLFIFFAHLSEISFLIMDAVFDLRTLLKRCFSDLCSTALNVDPEVTIIISNDSTSRMIFLYSNELNIFIVLMCRRASLKSAVPSIYISWVFLRSLLFIDNIVNQEFITIEYKSLCD